MSRPDALLFKGDWISTNLTEREKDIWEMGDVAGRSAALNGLRAQVEALIADPPDTVRDDEDLLNAVLALIDGSSQ